LELLCSRQKPAASIAGYAFSLMQLHYSRENEYQADTLGSQFAFGSGYDPAAMISVFHKLEHEHPSGSLNRLQVALSTHPKTPNRISRIENSPQLAPEPENYIRIADSYADRYYFHKAIEFYSKALEIEPEHPVAARGMGLAHLELGNTDEAAEWFELALEIEPGDEETIEYLKKAKAGTDIPKGTFAAAIPPGNDYKNSVMEGLGDSLASLEKISDRPEEEGENVHTITQRVESSFYKHLDSYRKLSKAVQDTDVKRRDIMNDAGMNFQVLFTALGRLDAAADKMPRNIENALRETRRINYLLENSSRLSYRAVWSADDMNVAITRMVSEEKGIRESLKQAAEKAEVAFSNTHDSLFYLSRSLKADEETGELPNFLLLGSELDDRLGQSRAVLNSAMELGTKTVEKIERQRLRLRRAILNFNAALLLPREEMIYRRMLSRRFDISPETIDALLEKDIGYADMLLAVSRGGRSTAKILAILNGFDPDNGYLDDFLIQQIKDVNSASLLLEMAEAELEALTQRRPLVGLEPGPLPGATEIFLSSGEIADTELERAAAAIDADRPGEAAQIIDMRGRGMPATAMSHYLLGRTYVARDEYESALGEYKYALKKDGKEPILHLALADAFCELERYDDAANEYAAAFSTGGDSASALARSAYCTAKRGRLEEAAGAYEKLIADHGYEHAGIYINLGLLYYQEGYIGRAADAFEKALQLEPDRPRLARMVEIIKNS